MKFRFLIPCIITALGSCTSKQETNVAPVEPTVTEETTGGSLAIDSTFKKQVPKVDAALLQAFLSLFKPLNPQGYHAYSPAFTSDLKVIDKQFQGVPIDAKKFQSLLPERVVPGLQSILKGYGGIFAIGKFEINHQNTGLVVRQHSQYSDTQISLLIWDKQKNALGHSLELADMFGDEGWFFDTESWITEYAQNQKLVIVTRTKNFDPNEDFTSGTVTDSMKVSRFKEGKFVSTTSVSQDTANFKLKRWKK